MDGLENAPGPILDDVVVPGGDVIGLKQAVDETQREGARPEIVGCILWGHAAGGHEFQEGERSQALLNKCGAGAGPREKFLEGGAGAMGLKHFGGRAATRHGSDAQAGCRINHDFVDDGRY